MSVAKRAKAPTLSQVARKRGWQALVQSLVIDIVVAIALLLMAMADTITSTEGLQLFGLALIKTVVITIAQWVVRRWGDRAGYDPDGNPVEG